MQGCGHRMLLVLISFDPAISIVDSFPIPVCRFGRAYRCRRLSEQASAATKAPSRPSTGSGPNLRVCWPGVIADGHLAPANLHDLAVAEDLLAGVHGWAPGDRGYWSPARAGLLADQGVWLLAPSRSVNRPGPHLLAQQQAWRDGTHRLIKRP
jgi:hypothetical protein